MPLYLGDSGNQPSRIYVGNTRIQRVYRGTTRLWPPRALYVGWNGRGTRTMYRVDPVSGAVTRVGATGAYGVDLGQGDSEVVNAGGTWYGVYESNTGAGRPLTSRIATVNKGTGVWTVARTYATNFAAAAAGWDGTTLYAMDVDTVWSVSLTSSVVTRIGSTQSRSSGLVGMVWDGSRFLLLTSSGILSEQSVVPDPTLGIRQLRTTRVATIPPPAGSSWAAFAYDADSDTYYGVAQGYVTFPSPPRRRIAFYTLNVVTGTATRLGTGQVDQIGNITPEIDAWTD